MDAYPYIISNNKIEPVLAKIRSAARPQRVTAELLKKWGFTASNDRAMTRILKVLGFLDENGAPTPEYDRLRDPTDWQTVLGERVKSAYADLYSIDENIHNASDAEVSGAIARVTGKDEDLVSRYLATFRTLARLSEFDGPEPIRNEPQPKPAAEPPSESRVPKPEVPASATHARNSLHYNIQIHLPATNDVSVFNAIFRSLRENLLI